MARMSEVKYWYLASRKDATTRPAGSSRLCKYVSRRWRTNYQAYCDTRKHWDRKQLKLISARVMIYFTDNKTFLGLLFVTKINKKRRLNLVSVSIVRSRHSRRLWLNVSWENRHRGRWVWYWIDEGLFEPITELGWVHTTTGANKRINDQGHALRSKCR
jgi:hypothetical protein